jgi:hydrogenase maturation protein HypF
MVKTQALSLMRINVRGVVQGVGFRPFIYQLAASHHLNGWVCNTSGDVSIEVEGASQEINSFLVELREKAPPLARINDISFSQGTPVNYDTFEIRESIAEEGKYQLVSPDIATCPDCLREILDPADRRFRYPFTNCTNCGPRFTIIKDIPYDRPKTTMKVFRMCPECQAEYDNPLDRRFHAQPNACPVCGPQLELVDNHGNNIACEDIIVEASRLLKNGKIIAVKGLGGFLLACDATSRKAVETLRQRKKRPAKPLAVMVTSLEEAGNHCVISDEEAGLLTAPGSPIVLLQWKPDSSITAAVATGLKYLGAMLPYTPLHHLLLRETGRPLVMTSGNLSEEPIAKDTDEALRRLSGIADYFLMHNRDIYARYDDSVTIVENGGTQFVRRARGYAPYPVHLSYHVREILGCGAEEKNTFCLTRDNFAFVSQHIGDMENIETLESYTDAISLYRSLFRITPGVIAYDMHPEYLSTKYAREILDKDAGLTGVPVQHHHAHIASCMADNGITEPVIGVSFDGTGYGPDGHIWGGEFLMADYESFDRMAHLEYLPLPGGPLAIKKPYRTAIGYLLSLGIEPDNRLPLMKYIKEPELEIIRDQLSKNINTPLTSSMGRLFDAVSALIGLRGVIEYEAQAAIDLEMLASKALNETAHYPFSIAKQDDTKVIKIHDLLAAIQNDLHNRTPVARIAARFHNTIAQIILEICQKISPRTGNKRVTLSGGVFQNRLLLRKALSSLEGSGFEVYTHRQVPCNDGGISLGQVVIANAVMNRGEK